MVVEPTEYSTYFDVLAIAVSLFALVFGFVAYDGAIRANEAYAHTVTELKEYQSKVKYLKNRVDVYEANWQRHDHAIAELKMMLLNLEEKVEALSEK